MLNAQNPIFALLGNPNSGKTTLFNQLTGGKEPVGNWSGVTVTQQMGKGKKNNVTFDVIDLPGTYSLTIIDDDPIHDEALPATFLKQNPYHCVINVLDANTLERQLYLTLQAREQQIPLVVVINRLDLLKRKGKTLSLPQLQSALGCTVWSDEHFNIQDLCSKPIEKPFPCQWQYPEVIEQQITQLSNRPDANNIPRWQVLRWLEGEKPVDHPHLASDILNAQMAIETALNQPADVVIAKTRYDFIEQCLHNCTVNPSLTPPKSADKLDGVLCHRVWGLPCFLGIMYALFFFAIGIGGLFQECLESAANAFFVDLLSAVLADISAPIGLQVLLVSGIGQGVTTLITFVPVIGAMFLALSFLEECGYMARAAFVMDRVMRAVGLPGKSFVPMIIGFGCNVPAILGTRTLDNRRDRILAVMMSPFMSCGARLAIFTVFVAAFFPRGGQNIVFLLYLIGIAMAIGTGLLLKKTLLKGNNAPFLLEMPRYQWPPVKSLWRVASHRLKRFLINAGKLIIPVCMVIGLSNQVTPQGHWISEHETSRSVLSVVGQTMVPVFEPMGIEEDNWPAAVGLLTGLMAKEVVIGTLNALYVNPAQTAMPDQSYGEMVKRFHGKTNAFAYLLFVLLYFPCMSATAAMLREVQKGWTLFSVCWTTGLAYAMAVGFYQCATFGEHPLQSSLWLGGIVLTGAMTWMGINHYGRRSFYGQKVPTRVVLT